MGGEEWDFALAGEGFVPGLVEICVSERWYCAVDDSTKSVTEGNGSGGFA